MYTFYLKFFKKINYIVIIQIIIIIQCFEFQKNSWCQQNLNDPIYYTIVNSNTTKHTINQSDINLKYDLYNIMKNRLRFSSLLKKNMIIVPYQNLSTQTIMQPHIFQIKNNSINILNILNNYNKYLMNNNNISFIQFGIQDFMSEKFISLGTGKRNLCTTYSGIGYNAFYHHPIVNKNQKIYPNIINFGGEYWFYNTKIFLNNFYDINKVFNKQKLLLQYEQNPYSGYQIGLQNQILGLTRFISIIKMECLFHNSKKMSFNHAYNKKIDYHLNIDIEYKPIPMIGLKFNNIFSNKKHQKFYFQLLLNYQFNKPILQQISYKSNYISNLYEIIQPFIPIKIKNNDCHDIYIQHKYHTIVGFPGEIKNVFFKKQKKPIKWEIESLKNSGVNIVMLNKNVYKICLPYIKKNQNNQFIISYTIDSKKLSTKNKKHDIHIILKDYKKYPSMQYINNDQNINLNHSHDNIDQDLDEIQICSSEPNDTKNYDIFSDYQQKELNDNNQLPEELELIHDDYETKEFESLLVKSKNYQETEKQKSLNIFYDNQMCSNPDLTVSDRKNNFQHLLSVHRKNNFSKIGTENHLKKIEDSILLRKNKKYNNETKKIFSQFYWTQS